MESSIPINSPHPHFPCLLLRNDKVEGIMECVVEGINDIADEVLWQPTSDTRFTKCATIFIGSERIVVNVYMFVNECTGEILVQTTCESGYGWTFYQVWNKIFANLEANEKPIQKYVPRPEVKETQSMGQPSLSEQIRVAQIPAEYIATSTGVATYTGSSFSPRNKYRPNFLKSCFDNERSVGVELLESKDTITNQDKVDLFCCVGSDSTRADSRIRALSLVNRLLKEKKISDDSMLIDYLKEGLNHLYVEKERDKNQTPAFKQMMREYAELSLRVIEKMGNRVDNELIDSLQKVKSV